MGWSPYHDDQITLVTYQFLLKLNLGYSDLQLP
jgi:hypothetical protein